MSVQSTEMLALCRRILNRIHQLGNIYYDRHTPLHGRYDAYAMIAQLASKERNQP